MNLDGTGLAEVGNSIVGDFAIVGKTIFYTTGYKMESDGAFCYVPLLCRMNLDGSNAATED